MGSGIRKEEGVNGEVCEAAVTLVRLQVTAVSRALNDVKLKAALDN